MTAMSSMCSAVLANSSLTSIPLWPYFWNLNGEGNAAPVLRSVRQVLGQRLAGVLRQRGLGVERVDVRRAAVEEEMDDPLRLAREVRRLRAPGLAGAPSGAGASVALVAEQAAQAQRDRGPAPSAGAASRRLMADRVVRWSRMASLPPSIQSTNMNSFAIKRTWASCSHGLSWRCGGRGSRVPRPRSGRVRTPSRPARGSSARPEVLVAVQVVADVDDEVDRVARLRRRSSRHRSRPRPLCTRAVLRTPCRLETIQPRTPSPPASVVDQRRLDRDRAASAGGPAADRGVCEVVARVASLRP